MSLKVRNSCHSEPKAKNLLLATRLSKTALVQSRFLAALGMTRITALAIAALTLLAGCTGAEQDIPAFDGKSAYDLLKKQVAFGPRYSGVPGHEKTAEFIISTVKPLADGVKTQDFEANIRGKKLKMSNIAAYFKGTSDRWVLLAAHWDTRPTADLEITEEKRNMPIPGANDGASGVAALLELARALHAKKPPVGVFMVFFDGEDYGPGEKDMMLGAKRFAADLKANAAVDGKPIKIEYGILLDMIGDRDLRIYQEMASAESAPDIVDKVWRAAEEAGHKDAFIKRVKYGVSDDHIPLIRAGVKCIDVIDFDYACWHTLDDTPDKCSADSLQAVGDTIARVIYSEGAK